MLQQLRQRLLQAAAMLDVLRRISSLCAQTSNVRLYVNVIALLKRILAKVLHPELPDALLAVVADKL